MEKLVADFFDIPVEYAREAMEALDNAESLEECFNIVEEIVERHMQEDFYG